MWFSGHGCSYFFRSVSTLSLEQANSNKLSACISRVNFEKFHRKERERERVFGSCSRRGCTVQCSISIEPMFYRELRAAVHRCLHKVLAYRPAWNSCRKTPYPATRPHFQTLLDHANRPQTEQSLRRAYSVFHATRFCAVDASIAPRCNSKRIDTRLLESRG